MISVNVIIWTGVQGMYMFRRRGIFFVFPATQVYAGGPSFFNSNPCQLVQMAGIAIDGLKASIAPKS